MDINLVGIKIMRLRKERNYTQESLAELLSISPQAVSKWENGHSLPDTTLLPDLAKALDTSIDAILTESRIQILSAYYGDGIESHNVTNRLNRLIQNDSLEIMVSAATLACPSISGRPSYLIVKYQADHDVYYGVAENNKQLTINMTRKGFENNESLEIIAAAYGSAEKYYNVLYKIEHYRLFHWNEYQANHETFPSDPLNDEKDYLTFVYLNKEGIHMVTCEEGESIAYNEGKTELFRKQSGKDYLIPNVPVMPGFGSGMECSWAAALTAALQAMNKKTTYEQVMGVSGACYRLAFCSPRWDYSSVDGLVAYDYATPGYRAFGFKPKFADRVDKEQRSDERKYMVNEIRHNMPVLGINIRVAPEWGVICGYKDNGADLLCRTKYDQDILTSPDFEKGKLNPYDYLYVDNWPFIITYFSDMTSPPTNKENLLNSLCVFVESANQDNCRGYATGLKAYEVWINDLLDDNWYKSNADEQLARRLSVNQFCTLALFDARRSAYIYLSESRNLLADRLDEIEQIVGLFLNISEKAEQIHKLLDSGEQLDGSGARRFWTKEMRINQAKLLTGMKEAEYRAMEIARNII